MKSLEEKSESVLLTTRDARKLRESEKIATGRTWFLGGERVRSKGHGRDKGDIGARGREQTTSRRQKEGSQGETGRATGRPGLTSVKVSPSTNSSSVGTVYEVEVRGLLVDSSTVNLPFGRTPDPPRTSSPTPVWSGRGRTPTGPPMVDSDLRRDLFLLMSSSVTNLYNKDP